MSEPHNELIKLALFTDLAQYYDEFELIGEWQSEKDFAKYCWVKELGHTVEDDEIINWEKLFLRLPKYGFVGKYLIVRSGTSDIPICKVVYGFKVKQKYLDDDFLTDDSGELDDEVIFFN